MSSISHPVLRPVPHRAQAVCALRTGMLALLASMTLLTACGGGDSTPAPIEPPPVIVQPPQADSETPIAEATGPGELKAAQLMATLSLDDIRAAVAEGSGKGLQVQPAYAVQAWRLTYLTTDGQGREVLASGLVAMPVKAADAKSPVVSYQHATIYRNADAPTNNLTANEPPLLLAAMGFIVVASDYVGYGESQSSQHPYLLSGPTAAAVTDLLTAARIWRQREQRPGNGQLFLTGYSEGGYATLAAHRALQLGGGPHLPQLVASFPGAGPYDLQVTLDKLLDRVRDENRVVGALISPGFLRYLGSTVRNEVRRLLVRLLIPDDADVVFQTTVIDQFLADDTAGLARDASVHQWAPQRPVWLYHGRDDETVPYAASVSARDAMQARGAPEVSLTDCPQVPASHLGCVKPYFSTVLQRMTTLARDL